MAKNRAPRRRWRKVAAVLLVPALLGASELALRIFGIAPDYEQTFAAFLPTGAPFFEVSRRDGKQYWSTSPLFRLKAAPAGFLVPRPDNKFRIVVLGASTTGGYPFAHPGSFPRFLEAMLNGLNHALEFEVVNMGIPGIGSGEAAFYLGQALDADPDLVVVYTGHNDFDRHLSLSGRSLPSPFSLRLRYVLMKSSLYRLVTATIVRFLGREGDGSNLYYIQKRRAGMMPDREEPFWSDAERRQVERRFEENLASMISRCKARGVPLIVCTLVCNRRDFSPGGAAHSGRLSPEDLAAWNRYFEAGRSASALGLYEQALAHFRRAAAIDDGHAYLRFDLARTMLSMGGDEAMASEFQAAVDLDDLPLRAVSAINRSIREQSSKEGIAVADVERGFDLVSAGGIPGDDLILDHVHPCLEGNILIARIVFEEAIESGLIPVSGDRERVAMEAAKSCRRSIPARYVSDSYLHLAVYQDRLGRTARARDLCRRALEMDPDNEDLRTLLENLSGSDKSADPDE